MGWGEVKGVQIESEIAYVQEILPLWRFTEHTGVVARTGQRRKIGAGDRRARGTCDFLNHLLGRNVKITGGTQTKEVSPERTPSKVHKLKNKSEMSAEWRTDSWKFK